MYKIIDTSAADGAVFVFKKHPTITNKEHVSDAVQSSQEAYRAIQSATLESGNDMVEVQAPGSVSQMRMSTSSDHLLDTDLNRYIKNGHAKEIRTALQFVKSQRLWLDCERKITNGRIIWAHHTVSNQKFVIKHQTIAKVDVDFEITPGPAAAELRALMHMCVFMKRNMIGPFFCELVNHEIFFNVDGLHLSTTLNAYTIDFTRWIKGDEKNKVCASKPPNYTIATTFESPWLYTPCGGLSILCSNHRADVSLFNMILRGVLLQVCMALSQAQRTCLFSHNDMHSANIMFDTEMLGKKRLFVTCSGTFILPKEVPGIRIIDLQHTAMDTYNSNFQCNGKIAGYKDDIFNQFSLSYDIHRFCEYLVLELLRDKFGKIETDIRNFLWKAASVPGKCGVDEPPKFAAEVVWNPYLISGMPPEDCLRDTVFDVFRTDPSTPADYIFYQTPPPAEAQERYMASRCVRNFRSLSFLNVAGVDLWQPTCRQLVLEAFKDTIAPPRYIPTQNAVRYLEAFATNFTNTVMNRASLYHKHSKTSISKFLFQELVLLNTTLDHLFSLDLVDEVKLRMNVHNEAPMKMCALADAINIVVHCDWRTQARVTDFPDQSRVDENFRVYEQEVVLALKLHNVRTAARRPLAGSRLPAETECKLITIQHDHELEQYRQLLYNAVMSFE